MSEVNKLLAKEHKTFKIVAVKFQNSNKIYNYKTMLPIDVGDSAVVDAPSGFAVVTVLAIMPTGSKDKFELKWLVSKVDTTHYELCQDIEAEAKLTLNADAPKATGNSFGSRL
jgi:hypothetical protein